MKSLLYCGLQLKIWLNITIGYYQVLKDESVLQPIALSNEISDLNTYIGVLELKSRVMGALIESLASPDI